MTARIIGQITKGQHKGSLVRPCNDVIECPHFQGANGENVHVVYIADGGERGLVLALKSNEMKWL
jgi:hypothetical protein